MRFALALLLGLFLTGGDFRLALPAAAQDAESKEEKQEKQTQNAQDRDGREQSRNRTSRSPRKTESRSQDTLNDISRSRMNANAVTVLSGNRDGQSLGVAYALSAVLDDGENLRVLPMAGKGGAQNIRDILWLKGIDMGITQSNVLNHLAKTGELGDIKGQIAYVAKLFNEEMHVLARKDINLFEDLRGKKVNFGEVGSGTEITAELIFAQLGMNVEEVNLDQNTALAQLHAGEIAATILIAGKPSPAFAHLDKTKDLKFVSVPYRPDMEVDYYPAMLTHSEYPHLIPEGEIVDTVAVCAVLVAFNWNKYTYRGKKVAKFTEAFFDNFQKFHAPQYHPKWREVNFAATLEDWPRLPAAQEWIDRHNPKVAAAEEAEFKQFLAEKQKNGGEKKEPRTEAEREALFKAYLAWSKRKEGRD